MGKERTLICEHYQCAGKCAITNHECYVEKRMQHCRKYSPLKGSEPFKKDKRDKALSRARKRDYDAD